MPQFEMDITARFMRPEILTHPHIPRDLAGINPRTIEGKGWWDTVRRQAYAVNNGHCWACGGLSGNDPYHPWLEAHEYYDIDYEAGTATFREVTALCHSCHNFIHSGRLWALYQDGAITRGKVEDIVLPRLALLKQQGLKPFIFTQAIKYMLQGDTEAQSLGVAWTKDKLLWPRNPHWPIRWRMIYNGIAYYGDGTNEEEDDISEVPEAPEGDREG